MQLQLIVAVQIEQDHNILHQFYSTNIIPEWIQSTKEIKHCLLTDSNCHDLLHVMVLQELFFLACTMCTDAAK